MSVKQIKDYLQSFSDVWLDYPFSKNMAVFKVGPRPDPGNSSVMFALLYEDKKPIRISLRCDPELSKLLREKYEEVMPATDLNKNDWNTLVLSGQLDWEDLQGLIRHSYDLANNQLIN